MTLADSIDWISRFAIAFYFIWATLFNFKSREFQLSEFKRIGMPLGGLLLAIGLLMLLGGSLLLLYPSTVVSGAVVLIVFIASADLMFHRYWTYADPHEQVLHKIFLFEHVALIGGLLGIISGRL
ncbi:hypothetical protein [Pseudomonas thivervalensis]|uniref:hypothetical protein n=1 Tax=Pseudomonas thivervalensis TaxID=86265 RepID=UPI003D6C04BB